MEKMRFTLPQLSAAFYPLEKGMDVVICTDEQKVTVDSQENGSEIMYEYNGNIFRTFKLTQEEIIQAPERYLDYEGDTEPSEEMTRYATEMIDAYTLQLIEEGVLV